MSDKDIWKEYTKNIERLSSTSEKYTEIDKKIHIRIQPREWSGEPQEKWKDHSIQTLSKRERKKQAIQAKIDLHGLTQKEAAVHLARFFTHAQHECHRFVLVITGKGGNNPEKKSILRDFTINWFQSHPQYVIAYRVALPHEGGGGAFYVHVRKLRK